MNIKSTRQYICDKKVRLNAVPRELREKINSIILKNQAKRSKNNSLVSLDSQEWVGGEHAGVQRRSLLENPKIDPSIKNWTNDNSPQPNFILEKVRMNDK